MTKTEISNLALSHAREPSINGNVDTTTDLLAETVLLHYSQTLKAALGRVRPAFAQRRAKLTANATAPLFDWAYSFVLPTDFVEITTFNGDTISINSDYYEIEGRNLLTDEGEANIVYTRFEEDSALYDAEFIAAFALLLAAKITNARRGDEKRAESLLAQGNAQASQSSAKSAQGKRRLNSRDKILRSSRWTGVKRRMSTNDSTTGDGSVTYDS